MASTGGAGGPQDLDNGGHPAANAAMRQRLERRISDRPFTFNAPPPSGRRAVQTPPIPMNANPSSSILQDNMTSASQIAYTQSLPSPGLPQPTIPAKRGAPSSSNNDDTPPTPDTALPPASSTNISAGNANNVRKTNPNQGASDFVKKLYNMLEEEAYKHIVVWGSRGDSFVVKVSRHTVFC